MSSQNMEVVQCLSGCLKHIKYIPKILLRMSKAQATIGDWVALYKTLYHAVYIGDIAKTQPGNIEIFRKIKTAFTEDLHKCVNLISKTIDFEESKIKKRFVVLPHIDNNLDEKKRMFNGLPDLMSEVARQEIEGLSSDIKECVVSYLPEIGYLLVIEKPEGISADDDHTMEGLQFMFASNDQLFYKSAKTLELDDILGDTQLEIIDIELKTMHRLQTTILENTSVMLSIMDLAAQLDCLMSLAICAKEFGYVQPELVQENVISVKAGRHPLQELCCNMFVPNDIKMGGRNSKIKMITGPNACGKSVYLKQVALIVYMAHIGSFVPAEVATIGPCDGIFSRLKSTESVSNRMSTFMQDLSQVSQSLRSASARSLVILDEFGKGTESTDGLSLLTAVTKYWIQRQPDCPFLLVSTHFHSILQQRLLPSSPMVQYLTFDTLANEEELVFLYQLIPGHASSSYACKCAGQVGLPPQLVRRGQQVSDLLCQYKTVPSEDSPQSVTQRHRHERIVDKFLDLNLGLDDVGNFLKECVLKLCEDTPNGKDDMLDKDGNGPIGIDNQSKKQSHNDRKTNYDQTIHSNRIIHKDKANTSGSNEENFQPQRVAKSDLVRFESQENENTKSLAKRNDFTPLLCPAGDASHTVQQSKKLFRIESDSDQISQEKAVKGSCHNTPLLRYDCTNSKTLTGQNVLPKNGGTGLNTDKLSSKNSSVRDNSIEPLEPVEKTNPLFDYLSNKQNKTLRKSNLPVQQSHPPFATPSSSNLVRNEVYSKSLGLVAGTKRKMESLHRITNTQIKHEMLFNPPTPCLGVSSTNGSKKTAAPSSGPLLAKPVPSSFCTSARHDSTTTTTPTDTEDAKARKRSREIFRSLPCNQPDLLAMKFNSKNQALTGCQFGNSKYPQDRQSQVKMCSPLLSGFPKGLRSMSTSSGGIEAKSGSRGENSDTPSSGVTTSPKGEIKRECNSPDDYSSTS